MSVVDDKACTVADWQRELKHNNTPRYNRTQLVSVTYRQCDRLDVLFAVGKCLNGSCAVAQFVDILVDHKGDFQIRL